MQQELILDDIYDVWYTSFWQTPVGYGILFLLLCASVSMIIISIFWLRARRGSYKEQALRNLRQLYTKAQKGGESKKIYQELTRIIKVYTQCHYGLPRGLTDYELTAMLDSLGCDKQQQDDLRRIFMDAQMVKFGAAVTARVHLEKDIGSAISFIQITQYKRDQNFS